MAAVLARLMAGREFIVGECLTAADCVTVHLMDWADGVGLLAGFPALQAYPARLCAGPSAPPRIAQAFADIGRARS